MAPTSQRQVHCTEDLCYAVDVDRFRVVSFDPRTPGGDATAVVETTTILTYGLGFDGVFEDASALDRANLVANAGVKGRGRFGLGLGALGARPRHLGSKSGAQPAAGCNHKQSSHACACRCTT